ncbi:AN1-type zinc finger protein 2A isoform X8 [Balaenoptera musculus]|uniref:AN1-type zinc finger protein 2A isoform X8 n=1 Tax=Balaenoptera musculus TaxID=9771 RepID=A0A8B8VBF9_BALMU|nr:AN1-type zinc finger protein 2A isoform X8 [Balaenoptera musculus]
MEFPDLGKHCSEKTCKQLDFLPLECDACKQDFCKDHFTYAAHKCPFAFKKVLGGKGLGCLAVGGFTRGAGRLAGSALQVESKVTM